MHVEITQSRRLAALLLVAHAAAVAAAWANALPVPVKLLLTGIVLASALVHRRRPPAVTGLRVNEAGECKIRLGDGAWRQATPLGSTFVAPLLTVINLQMDGRRFPLNVVLLPDSLPPEDFRRLRVWLRWKCDV